MQHTEDRPRNPRIVFGGVVEVSAVQSSKYIVAVAARLSEFGCFARTTAPFPVGSNVTLRITWNGENFNSTGEVIYSEPTGGMGIAFTAISPSDEAILDSWLPESNQRERIAVPAHRIRTSFLDNFPVEVSCPDCRHKSLARISALKGEKGFILPCGHAFGPERVSVTATKKIWNGALIKL